MRKSKMLRLELIIIVMFAIFAALIIWGRREKELPQNEAEEEVVSIPQVDYEKIESISGKYYYEDEDFSSMFGIDVSEFQDEIDWRKVKEDKVEFVFIRIGRRGATTGLLYDDEMFERNYKGAKDNGIKVGVYFFSQAKDEKEALEEAQWVLERLKDKQLDLPVVYDCEEVYLEDETPRLEGIDTTQLTDNALTFLKRIEKDGYEGMIYTYLYWAENFYEMDRLTDYPFWFAQYDTDEPKLEYPVTIWQYSKNGTINGIKEATDLNIMFIRKNDLSE
ncbi:MAG: glycoside hydrolase family 25 protein [Erysipelotrichaceae bacterium]|nr:glycoside hydrolase family 25 protein [Erysipelotrichaceae bacterium]